MRTHRHSPHWQHNCLAADPVKYRARRKIETFAWASKGNGLMTMKTQFTLGHAKASRSTNPWTWKSFYLAADPVKHRARRKIETFAWASKGNGLMTMKTQFTLGHAKASRSTNPWTWKSFYLAADPVKHRARRKIETFDCVQGK